MKTFGWTKPERGPDGEITGTRLSSVRVRTIGTLPKNYPRDGNKRLIFTMHPHDVLGVAPEGTVRELRITAVELYSYLLRLASSEKKPATVSEIKAAAVPADLGRGGSQHQAIQHRICQPEEFIAYLQALAECNQGFSSSIGRVEKTSRPRADPFFWDCRPKAGKLASGMLPTSSKKCLLSFICS